MHTTGTLTAYAAMQTATVYRAIAGITVHTNRHTGIGIPNPAIATIVTGSRDTTVTTVVDTALPFGSVLVATTAAGGDFDRVEHRFRNLDTLGPTNTASEDQKMAPDWAQALKYARQFSLVRRCGTSGMVRRSAPQLNTSDLSKMLF